MKIKTNIAVSDSGFIFNPETGESYTVNPVGARVIQLLKDGKSSDEIAKEFLENYNVEPHTIEKDYEDFLGLLRNYSLVEDE